MRILHVYSGNLYGGVETILLALAAGRAPSSDHEFAVCFDGRLRDELVRAGAVVHSLGAVRLSRPQSVRAARHALGRVLDRGSFDCVICHAPWSQAMFGGVARHTCVPCVFWAHDVTTGRHWTERLARRHVPDLVICNSHFTAATLPHLYPGAPSAVVYAPVAPGRALPPGERAAVRASLATPADAIVILQASRSEPLKGHDSLVEALALIAGDPRWIWWQAGGAQRPHEREFLESVRSLADRLGVGGRVRWLGERDDVTRLLGAADIYCQANTSPESFGMAFVEALAAGVPVVTTSLGGACEIVDATCGVLVGPQDPPALASALQRLIADEPRRHQLGRAGIARAHHLCDPAARMRQLATTLAALPQPLRA
jgi:glycosyltransferase involved in cell wall biosynthesis